MNNIIWDYEFDLKINIGHYDIFHGPVILPYILKTIYLQDYLKHECHIFR